MLIEILIILFLVLLNGFFAMSELAVVSSRRVRLQQMADEGRSRGAKAALALVDDPANFLSAVQIGITLIGIFAGAFSGATFAGRIGEWLDGFPLIAPNGPAVAIALVVFGITYLSLVVGELVPKRLALSNAEAIAAFVARPMRVVAFVTYPMVWLLGRSTNAILRLLGQEGLREQSVTEEEVKNLIAEGTLSGVFEPEEKKMIDGVLRLADRTARSIMTPRPDVVWLDPSDEPARIVAEIRESGHSRLVVSRGDIDEVLGVVHAKDLLDRALQGLPFDLQATMRKPLIVHDGTPVLRLLEMFRETSLHIAVVVDEYGSVEGLVTVTDILSAIAGEFPDAGDTDKSVVRRDDGSWLIDGMTPIDEVEALIRQKDMRGEADFHTLAGFVLTELGHLPKPAEHFIWRRHRFEVVDMDGRRIDKVLVVPPAIDPDDEDGDGI
jgi:putative hemolysin